jgi:hypothetical protein
MAYSIVLIRRPRGIAVLLGAVVALGAALNAPAATADKFSALFDITDVVPVNRSQVTVTLILQLTNESGAEISNAQVSLLDNRLLTRSLGTFPSTVSIGSRAHTKLSATFIVPAVYIKMWHSAPTPRVVVTYLSAQGAIIDSPVRLRMMRGIGERS